MKKALPVKATILDLPTARENREKKRGQVLPKINLNLTPRVEYILLAVVILLGIFTHSYRLYEFPALSVNEDEGIYTSQAWTVLREGHLSPYTYFYDHPPAGWMQLAMWMGVVGVNTFGGPIETNRIFILLIYLVSLVTLWRVMRRLGCSVWTTTLGGLIFALSPIALFFQRLVLLDNIMTFWLLLSMLLLLDTPGRLSRFALSGLCFGLAFQSKETAAIFLPGMLVLLWQCRREHHRRFSFGAWFIPMVMIVSWYPLYALLKGELLPPGMIFQLGPLRFGTELDRNSLMGTLSWQMGRGSGGGLFNQESMLWRVIREEWLPRDAFMIIGGTIACFANVIIGLRNGRYMAIGLLGSLAVLFLMRGGVILEHYILIAVPFVAINVAMLAEFGLRYLPKKYVPGLSIAALTITLLLYCWQVSQVSIMYHTQTIAAHREATAWVMQNVPPESRIVTQDTFWTDLRDPRISGVTPFKYVFSHWKVGSDPSVYSNFFKDDWSNIDYVFILGKFTDEGSVNGMTTTALKNAVLVKRWERLDVPAIELWQVINNSNHGYEKTAW